MSTENKELNLDTEYRLDSHYTSEVEMENDSNLLQKARNERIKLSKNQTI